VTSQSTQFIPQQNPQPRLQPTSNLISQQLLIIEKSIKNISDVINQLLEMLKQWSKQQASNEQVSDVYICFENEFDHACEVFAAFNFNNSDLEHHADLLHIALKATLSQNATEEGFENTLRQLQNLTNVILLGLKCKQEKLRHSLIEEVKGSEYVSENIQTGTGITLSLGSFTKDNSLIENDVEKIKEHTSSTQTDCAIKNHDISLSFLGREKTTRDYLPPIITREENLSSPLPPPPMSSKNAFAVLERRGILKTRASRIYSTDQTCKPICDPPENCQNLGTGLNKIKDTSALKKENQFLLTPPLTPLPQNNLTLFLQYKTIVKKFILSGGYSNLSITRLQFAFIEKFDWNNNNHCNRLPDIYIEDPLSGIWHVLEDLSDVKDGSLLVLNVEALDEAKCLEDEGSDGIKKIIEDIKVAVGEQKATIQQVLDRQQVTAKELNQIQANVSSISEDINHRTAQNCTTLVPRNIKILGQEEKVDGFNRDLLNLRQSYSSHQSEIQKSLNAVCKVSEDLQKAVAEACLSDTINDFGRKYVENKKKSINGQCDKLVSNVDELMNAVKDLRLDVAVRCVEPPPRKLQTVFKDMALADMELKKMKKVIIGEKPVWNKTWDKEIQRVRDDKENMRIYEGLVDELQDDVTKASRILALVKPGPKVQTKIPQAS
ncbi:hypothetical protein EPUL_005944, partial [Erysiphe pulchra]